MKPSLNWVTIANENLASKRIRINAVQRHLGGSITREPIEADIHLYSKHFNQLEREWVKQGKTVYDVCDDRFRFEGWGDHYRHMIQHATLVTCNTQKMAEVIKSECGRDAEIIPDSCEGEILPVSINERIMWYGHKINLSSLPIIHGMEVLTNLPSGIVNGCAVIEWSQESQKRSFERNGIVIITHDKNSLYKSHNRLTTALRAGKFVVCNPIPSYEEFAPFTWQGKNILEGIDWVNSHPSEAEAMVKAGQEYTKKYEATKVAKEWSNVLASIYP